VLEVIGYLRQHGLDRLQAEYAIKVNRHTRHPHLVMLKYDQIRSPMSERIVQECRGLILDEAREWAIVSFPYLKFFNYGEGAAAPIDWSTARVLEKLDGSLMTLYFYDGEWHVASSGVPDACGTANGCAKLMRELFWDTWNELAYRLPQDTGFVYMFELMTRHNRVIVRHEKARLELHGVRDMRTYVEVDPEPFALLNGWECVRSYPLTTLDEILEAASALDPLHNEGFVVRDAAFNRIKVKSPHYVALHHMTDGWSPKRMLEKIVLPNENQEFLTYFPEYEADYLEVKGRFEQLVAEAETFYRTVQGIESQKEFALAVKDTKFGSALFAVRAGKAPSIDEFYRNMVIDRLMQLLGLKDVPRPEE